MRPIFLIFTDLDGTLLDHETYGWQAAEPAFRECQRRGIPVVLVSSKTRAEMVMVRAQLDISSPFISENGGGIFFEKGTFGALEPLAKTVMEQGLCKLPLGTAYENLVKCLGEIKKELGWRIRGFSDMTLQEISERTGLDHSGALMASQREFDEPFVVLEPRFPEESVLSEAAKRRGYRITTGGRFHHLHGENDKGQATDKIKSWYWKLHGNVTTIALGDSPNDFPMLQRADFPVLVRSKRDFPDLEKAMPNLRRTREKGPKGWNSAVAGILEEKEA
jgi:mannosyl-3-phosphoglycerate phosphatase